MTRPEEWQFREAVAKRVPTLGICRDPSISTLL